MNKSIALLAISVVVALGACSSSSGGNPVDDCNSVVAATCKRFYSCFSGAQITAIEQAEGFTSESDCETKLSSMAGCAKLPADPCPSGESYDSSAVDSCVSALDDESCTDLSAGTVPSSCSSSSVSSACH